MATTAINLTPRDFKGKSNPDWCAGCGDFGVLNAIQRAVAEMGFRPHDIMTVSGIGCSSNLPGYINTYGILGRVLHEHYYNAYVTVLE